jgi:4-hydroxy-3-methylbut-2-enyl diphosphate reductase
MMSLGSRPFTLTSSSPTAKSTFEAGESKEIEEIRAPDTRPAYEESRTLITRLEFVNVDKVVLAAPRGFCAGVEKAIKALDWMTRVFAPPVFCYHEIVHNQFVVDYFKSLGVVFIDDVTLVPPGAPVMLSAHGSPPEVIDAARQSGGTVIDAVCPLVTKVHHELKVRARKGYTVLYVGHQGHEEAVGTMAVAPESVHLIESTADIDALGDLAGPFALLSQTTLSLDEWQDLREYAEVKFPEIWMPNRSDLCFATTNRQAALRTIAAQADAVVVIGSANSSNTVALTKVAEAVGCARVLRVNGAFELPDDLRGTVAVTAGASAPESLVNEVLEALNPTNGVTVTSVTVEDEYFPPPPELREMLKTLSALLDLSLATPATSSFDGEADRRFTAAEVLSAANR